MEQSSVILLGILLITMIFWVLYLYSKYSRSYVFNQYFKVEYEESYNLDNIFQVKIHGRIIPTVSYLDIPYEDITVEIHTPTIRGNIKNNFVSIELVRPQDRRKAIMLVKSHYYKAVKSFIKETVTNKKEHIYLLSLAEKQKIQMHKIACHTCKHRVQCQISFTECKYERVEKDILLHKGIKIDISRVSTLPHYKKL
ncbi:hypothetical protein Amet_1374 [Alkaliphilus metalliredigens QYMF]|uniref:Uncharacterized protein n=1 Tax=Alkaliphilus metalliredigens (strain QYMF) TaxID=293826 RepID=A6TN06_ALKMQ|nr:hypothetical protein [Alkaliphilus metalliredigens]ABR47574.1 hypothetical protein Amet_1374 [Alkaliphilus metalliredigens QYMF]